jgi:hypothetical protein
MYACLCIYIHVHIYIYIYIYICIYIHAYIYTHIQSHTLQADVWRRSTHPLTRQYPYRSKAVFAFQQCADGGGEVTLFGMYVHEFGPESYHLNQGRAYVQCIDSTPLYGAEKGEERQEILTAILCGYFEFARSAGFEHVHLHVPPPTDESAFIFTSRSLHVRLRACMHLAHWYRRLLEASVQEGVIHSFQVCAFLGVWIMKAAQASAFVCIDCVCVCVYIYIYIYIWSNS